MKKTLLKRKTPLRKITPKTADRNQDWKEICLYWIVQDVAKHGHPICWWCRGNGCLHQDSFNAVWGHHKDGDRNNCTLENCYIVHNRCQHEIHENHIDVKAYPTKQSWELAK